MYGTIAAFDYIVVGGRCTYETNKVFEFPTQPFDFTNSLYATVHSGIRCDFMDTSSYFEVSFSSAVDSNNFYMLKLVYYVKNIDSLKLKIKWKKEGEVGFCANCYEDKELDVSQNEFLYADINLLQNTEWVGKITDLRLYVFNTEIVPLFIKYFSVYSPTVYKCSCPTCPYYSKYIHPCPGGKDLHILLGKFFDGNSIKLNLDSKFEFSIYGITFIVEFESGYYFLDTILNKLNNFFDSMPVPCLQVIKEGGKIKLSCDYVKPMLVHTELSEVLGFFDSEGSEFYTYTIENSGSSDYVDVAGNLKGIYRATELNNLDFNEVFGVGFSDGRDSYPTSNFDFLNQTVIFYTLSIPFDGYLNHFELHCQVFSGGGKILIYRRNGNTYNVVNSYFLAETIRMSKHNISWLCRVYKGDIIGIYNLKIGTAKHGITTPINYYGAVSGYSTSINKESIEAVSFSSVSLYAYFESPTTNDIPILAVYDEEAYVDKLSFLLNYLDSYNRDFNIIFNNNFNYKITGCQVNVKDSLDVVTEIPGEIVGIEYLSDNKVFTDIDVSTFADSENPPIDLLSMVSGDSLRYSWHEYIIDVYEDNNYTYTFIPGSVLFYYEFPTIIDIYSVLIHSAKKETTDNCLLEVLDNIETSPSFSNPNDIVILNEQMRAWEFNIENGIETKGVGVFVYNYGELPNISFSEVELFTKIGSIPSYVINIAGIVRDDRIVSFNLESVGTKNEAYIGIHLKSLLINIGFITDKRTFSFNDINVYSSFIPDNYFISESGAGEGTLKVYNVRSKKLKCYLLDYSINSPTNLIYEYDFDNSILHKGFVPTQYTHSKFYFVSGNYINNKYTTYALKNMINVEDFFVTKFYDLKIHEYDDWYVPYDYLIPGRDGQFVYIDGGLKLKPVTNEAIRWFNYININEFYNDIDIELRFDYVGNIEDFVYIGLTCCDRNYDNYLKFYSAFQTGSEYGLEFKLKGDADPTYYKFAAIVGRNTRLKINKRGDSWTFSCFYSDMWHELTTFSLFDTEVLVSISTIFNASHIKGSIITEFISCEIKASKIISGKKIWYTINDGLDYIYSGNVLDDSIILDNIDKSLTFCRDYTIKKFVYNFNTTSIRYLKFVNEATKSIKITEIKCYVDDTIVPIHQGYVSYSDDLFFGILEGETLYLDDSVIINYDLSNAIRKGGDGVLSAVGVDFSNNIGINKAVVYYVKETGSYEPCRLMYSYDNIVYYDVYDNFSLFSKTTYTAAHYLFNEFVGCKGKNEIAYDFISNNQYSTDFSEEGVLDYKWSIASPYVVDGGGVWLKHLTGAESLYSTFSIDGDFIIDVHFDSYNGYSSGEASIILKVIFKNNTSIEDVSIKHRFDNNYIYASYGSAGVGVGDTSGRLRIKRTGSVFYFYYRKYGTTWYEVGSNDYGYDYIYPVDINVCLYGDNSFNLKINKILITEGTGISDKDLELLESPGLSTLFIRGRQFSSNDTYAIAGSWSMTKPVYPFSFSWLGGVNSSIPSEGLLVSKPYSIGLTYEEKDLSLWWFSEYFVKFKIDNVLSYSSDVNTLSSISVGNYNMDGQLFTNTSDHTIKAIYKSRYDVNTIIDETFKTGEGTFDKVHEDLNCQPGYLFDNFNGDDGEKASRINWITYDSTQGSARIQDDQLYFSFFGLTSIEYTYTGSTYNVFGNFDIQTTFSGLFGLDTTGCGLEIKFQAGDSSIYMKAGYDAYGGGDGRYFLTDINIDNIWQDYNRVLRVNDYGKIRIVRTNGNVTVYYKDGDESNWTEFHTFSSFFIDKGRIFLGLWPASSLDPSGYFDDFILSTSEDVDCQVGILGDFFTGSNGSEADTNDWVTYDSERGSVRIQDNKLRFSFSS